MATAPRQARMQSVDALRGAIIIIMALDHVRDFTSVAAMNFLATDLTQTTAVLFFTRWITHFCAPVFAFTAGIGAFFWKQHGRTTAELSRFLVTRGLWLMFLEVTVFRFIAFFQWRFHGQVYILVVFWMLGLSMVTLAALVHLPARILAPLSLLVIALHNLCDSITAERFGHAAWLWVILHAPGAFPFFGATVAVAYPLLPWCAVMASGYCFGSVLLWDPPRRQTFLIRFGSAVTLLFIVLRASNRYGDPARWSHQPTPLFTLLSFLNTTKYPPSLSFLLMTLGPALIALALVDQKKFSSANPLIVFGRVPFFFFLFHFALAHVLAVTLAALRYGTGQYLLLPPPSMGGPANLFPPNYGFSLPVVYLTWLAVVAISYPLCRWYAGLRQRRRDLWWLSYL